MTWGNNGPYKTEGDSGYREVMSDSRFADSFDEGFIVLAYIDYLEGYKEGFEGTIQELDDGDTWNIRYYQGCVEAFDSLVVNSGHGSFSWIVENCEHRLQEIDEYSQGISKQNDYWRRYFDGQVQTYTEIKKQAEKWDEVMGWLQAFDND